MYNEHTLRKFLVFAFSRVVRYCLVFNSREFMIMMFATAKSFPGWLRVKTSLHVFNFPFLLRVGINGLLDCAHFDF